MTLLSLLIQGTTVITSARRLGLISPTTDFTDFGVELPEELPTSLTTLTLTDSELSSGNTLRDMNLPEGSLVMMVRRGEKYMVPNGALILKKGDSLLIIKEEDSDRP